MKSIIMSIKSSKTIKVSLLVIFTSLLPLVNASAQRKALTYQDSGAPIEVGDSVMKNAFASFIIKAISIDHYRVANFDRSS